MASYKYLTEHSVHMQAEHMFLIQQDDLELEDNIKLLSSYPCHIYSICSRPKIKIDRETLKINDNFIEGNLLIQIEDEHKAIPFKRANNENSESKVTSFETKYPYTSVSFLMSNGQSYSDGKLGYLYSSIINKYDALFNLKVLYIGQAFGEDGNRIAPDRLFAHSTLQKIYQKALNNNPDKDIWIILWTYIPKLISFTHSTLPVNKENLIQNEAHYDNVIEKPISLEQRVNFTEAAMIKYFQPEYNDKFKEHFPSKRHTSYKECFDLDINSVSFELETSSLVTQLYSDVVEPKFVHIGQFPLHSKAERIGLFDYLNIKEKE